MFGYIRPYKPEMKIKEFDTYKAVYCGLCKQLGRAYGPFARMTLSYDFTFLSLIALSLREECGGFRAQRCAANPLKKKPCLVPCGDLTLGASTAMIMFYYKLRDNIQDSGFAGRLKARLLLPFAAPARKKAARLYPEIETAVADCMREQAQVERSDSLSVDRAAEPTARALSLIFAGLSEQPAQQKVLARLGYLVGRYVYLIDALDDLEEDRKTGCYNILDRRARADGLRTEDGVWAYAREVLNLTVGQIAAAYELLELRRFRPILDNVIYLGLHHSVEQVLENSQNRRGPGRAGRPETDGTDLTV